MQVKVTRDNGALKVDIDGKLFAPLSFKSFRPNERNVTEFYNVGVRLFSVLSSGVINALGVPYSRFGESWVGDKQYDFSVIDKQMDMFIKCAPNGYFAPMFMVDTRNWYLEMRPEIPNSFKHLSQTAHDQKWREDAAEYLKAVITHCEEKYGDKIYGYFILGGMTTEWLAHPDREESHPIKEKAYKKWLGDENATLPTLEEHDRKGDAFLTEDEDNVRKARRFHNETVSDILLYFASAAQSVIKHKKLLGAYYGYLLHLGNKFLFNAGHIDFERVFLSPDIDMISSPSDYSYRQILDPSGIMVTQKTLDKHNKLYFLEFDHITHVAPTMIYEETEGSENNTYLKEIPGAPNKCKDETESLNLMWRDYIMCYGNGTALWWFDMFDGWFRSEGMMSAISKMINICVELDKSDKSSIAEIAVFAEGDSLYNVRKESNIPGEILSKTRRTLAECGAPYDIYSIGDIENLDERYKLIILLNQFEIPESRIEKIRQLQQKGVYVLWIYAPSYVKDGKNSVDGIAKTVGMQIKESKQTNGALIVNGEAFENRVSAPYFSIESGEEKTYACFENGTKGVAKNGMNIYSAMPLVPTPTLRSIIDDIGIYTFSKTDKVYTYVNAGCIGVYNATETDAKIYVKQDGVYLDKISEEKFVAKDGIITLSFRDLRAYLLIKE